MQIIGYRIHKIKKFILRISFAISLLILIFTHYHSQHVPNTSSITTPSPSIATNHHLFIYNAFIYSDVRSFNSENRDTLAVLALYDQYDTKISILLRDFRCKMRIFNETRQRTEGLDVKESVNNKGKLENDKKFIENDPNNIKFNNFDYFDSIYYEMDMETELEVIPDSRYCRMAIVVFRCYAHPALRLSGFSLRPFANTVASRFIASNESNTLNAIHDGQIRWNASAAFYLSAPRNNIIEHEKKLSSISFFELPVKKANSAFVWWQKRDIVICISRMFYFERWQIMLLALELYRQYKIDLTVVHVNIVLKSIFDVLKAYEKAGTLAIRVGIEDLPYDKKTMDFNPSASTEMRAQLVLLHDCFYEFRESADFILPIDWDDILFTESHATPLDALRAATLQYPQASVFQMTRIMSVFKTQNLTANKEFKLSNFAATVLSNQDYKDPKMAIRPAKVSGFYIHDVLRLPQNRTNVILNRTDLAFLHIKSPNSTHAKKRRLVDQIALNKLNITEADKFVRQSVLNEQLIDALPLDDSEPYYKAIEACNLRLLNIFKHHCYIAYDCGEMPRRGDKFVVAHNAYAYATYDAAVSNDISLRQYKMHIHTRTSSEFMEKNE